MSLKISDDKNNRHIDFSELVNSSQIFIYAYGGGNTIALTLSEKEIRELTKHLTIQIRKIKKPK